MTDWTHVTKTEHGVVRVFILVRPPELHQNYSVPLSEIGEWLGHSALNAADIQQIWTSDLSDMSLPDLLRQGYGIDDAQIMAQQDHLEGAMDLHPTIIVIIRSSGFMNRPAKLATGGPLFMLAVFQEPGLSVAFEALPDQKVEAPKVKGTPKAPSDAAMAGRVASVALLVMAALVGIMIWVAG